MRLKLAYGRSGLWIDLPEEVKIDVIEPECVPGLRDERGAIVKALRSPVNCRPVRELVGPSDEVAVVFSDLTRPMPNDRILPPLLDELSDAGVQDERIVLINALGTHRPQTEEELQGMLGKDLIGRFRVVQHDAWDSDSLVAVTTNHAGRAVRVNRAYQNASVRILTGFIEPHLFAGFSGGPKAIMPGLSDAESILDNHGAELLAAPSATWAVIDGNPVWEEMLHVALSTVPTFLLNVTLNWERAITGVFAGDLVEAHRQGCEFAREVAVRPIREPYDVVITSNSGYPLDLNLYQAVKGMSAAARMVKEGGDIIIAAECWDGIPVHGEYRRLLWEAETPQALLERLRSPGFRCHDQWEAQLQAQVQLRARVHVYADGLTDDELRRAHVLPCRSIERTLHGILGDHPGATVAVLPDGPQTVPVLPGQASP